MKLNHLAPPHVSKDMNYSIDREGNILFNFVAFQIFSLSYCFFKDNSKCVLAKEGHQESLGMGLQLGGQWLVFMCLETPRALAQLLKNRSQSEVLIFLYILEASSALERLIKLS